MSKRLQIVQTRSRIGMPKKHKRVLDGLGLKGPHHSIVRKDNDAIRGMLRKVKHLVSWQAVEVEDNEAQ